MVSEHTAGRWPLLEPGRIGRLWIAGTDGSGTAVEEDVDPWRVLGEVAPGCGECRSPGEPQGRQRCLQLHTVPPFANDGRIRSGAAPLSRIDHDMASNDPPTPKCSADCRRCYTYTP